MEKNLRDYFKEHRIYYKPEGKPSGLFKYWVNTFNYRHKIAIFHSFVKNIEIYVANTY